MRSLATLLLLAVPFGGNGALIADDLPAGPFPATRYSALWENSPFAVATPVATESIEYSLVGAAQVEGVSYLSIIDKQSQEHFVVTSTTPSHGLSVVTLTRDPTSTFATLRKDGGIIKLPLEGGAAPTGPSVFPNTAPVPVVNTNVNPGYLRHGPPRFHRTYPPIYVPEPSAVPNSQ